MIETQTNRNSHIVGVNLCEFALTAGGFLLRYDVRRALFLFTNGVQRTFSVKTFSDGWMSLVGQPLPPALSLTVGQPTKDRKSRNQIVAECVTVGPVQSADVVAPGFGGSNPGFASRRDCRGPAPSR
jgi:hypothetical protein